MDLPHDRLMTLLRLITASTVVTRHLRHLIHLCGGAVLLCLILSLQVGGLITLGVWAARGQAVRTPRATRTRSAEPATTVPKPDPASAGLAATGPGAASGPRDTASGPRDTASGPRDTAELARLCGAVDDILGRVGEDTGRLEEMKRRQWHLTSGVTRELRDSLQGLRTLLEAVPRRPGDRAELITSAAAQAARIQTLIDTMGNLAGPRPGEQPDVPRFPR